MLSSNEIQNFARQISAILSEDEGVELLRPLEEILERVTLVLTRNMDDERRVNAECDKIMEQYAREIERGSVDPHEMFLMIKRKLAKERGFIL